MKHKFRKMVVWVGCILILIGGIAGIKLRTGTIPESPSETAPAIDRESEKTGGDDSSLIGTTDSQDTESTSAGLIGTTDSQDTESTSAGETDDIKLMIVKPEAQPIGKLPELPVTVHFQYRNHKGRLSTLTPEELEKFTLTHNDYYRLLITGNEDCYLYIFQRDSDGEELRLFPNPEYNSDENPIRTGIVYHFPSGDKGWYALEELTDDQTLIKETICLMVSDQSVSVPDKVYSEYRKLKEEERARYSTFTLGETEQMFDFKEVAFSHKK